MRQLLDFFARLKRDQRGVSAVEFAFIAPVLIVFYFGMVETCQVLMAERKVVRTSSAIGDLVAQSAATITVSGSGGLNDIMDIADTLMEPFNAGSSLKVCIASISSDSTNKKTVDWSKAKNGATCPAAGATVSDMPSGLMEANQSMIMSRVTYSYTGTLNMVIKSNPTFVKTFYLRPRKVSSISCTGC